MINYEELTGSVLTLSQLEKRLFDSSKGKILNFDFTDELNKILERSEESVDEAYIRYSFIDNLVHDSLKLKIIARSENVIIVYSKTCTKEFNWEFKLKSEYKYKFETVSDAVNWIKSNDISNGRYFMHYKGLVYKFLHEGTGSEDKQDYVVYKAMYGDKKVWIRPKSMFFEEVEVNGKLIPRFKEITAQNKSEINKKVTVSELLGMALINLNLRDSTPISRSIGLAQIDQAKRMLDKGYQVNEYIDDIIEKDPEMEMNINIFTNN